MIAVGRILRAKGHTVWTISPEESVYNAMKLMAEKDIGAIVVVDRDRIVGILSERDYARKIVLRGRSSSETTVLEIMTREVITVHTSQGIDECMAIMTGQRVRHLPVVEEEVMVGIISIGDVVKAIIADQEETIRHLEQYISGTR